LQHDREARKGLAKLEQTLGMPLADLDSITVLMLPPPKALLQRSSIAPYPGGGRGRPVPGFNPYQPPLPKAEMKLERELLEELRRKVEVERQLEERRRQEQIRREKEQQEKPRKEQASLVSLQEVAVVQPQDIDPYLIEEYLAATGPLMIVTSTKPIDRKKILQAELGKARRWGIPYDTSPRAEPSVLFLSERSLLVGAPWELASYSELVARKAPPKSSPLQQALALGAEPHLIVAGGHLPAEVRRIFASPEVPDDVQRLLAPVSALLSTEASLTLDLKERLEITLRFHAHNDISADATLEAVKSLRVLAELGLEQAREAGEPGGAKLDLEKKLKQALADTTIDRNGMAVRAQLKLDVPAPFFKRFTKEIVSSLRQQGDRRQSADNLKNIALAMHSYHDANKTLPPAGIDSVRDGNGKAILSWRVAILPYIDQAPLYNQFDLTKPWDDPHNKKLIAKMPQIYVVPGTENKPGMTNYRVLVGPGTMFEPRQGPGGKIIGWRLIEVLDGTSNTIMIVEAADPTIWTRPDDLPYDPNRPLPKLGVSPDGFNAAFGDGSVRFIRSDTREDYLRAYITRAGGEAIP
jgi:hypothetical protein